MTRLAAFLEYGAVPRNIRNSLSAVSADGKTVVVTLMQRDFQPRGNGMIYELRNWGSWFRGPGANQMLEHLAWAAANCGGVVRVIVVLRERTASGRERATCFTRQNLVMRVTYLDAVTGSFTLEQVMPIIAAKAA
jgi:hypothetical protein